MLVDSRAKNPRGYPGKKDSLDLLLNPIKVYEPMINKSKEKALDDFIRYRSKNPTFLNSQIWSSLSLLSHPFGLDCSSFLQKRGSSQRMLIVKNRVERDEIVNRNRTRKNKDQNCDAYFCVFDWIGCDCEIRIWRSSSQTLLHDFFIEKVENTIN